MTSREVARLTTELESFLARADGVRAVYLFGSSVHGQRPNDIDILVIYGPPLVPGTASSLEPLVNEAVARACFLPAHLVLFCEAEARERHLMDGFQPLVNLFGELEV